MCKQLSLLCPSNNSQWHFTSLGIFIKDKKKIKKICFLGSTLNFFFDALFKYVCHIISDPRFNFKHKITANHLSLHSIPFQFFFVHRENFKPCVYVFFCFLFLLNSHPNVFFMTLFFVSRQRFLFI